MPEMKLIEAVKEGDPEAVRALLAEGADTQEQDEQGWAPLQWAAGAGNAEIVRTLLEHGADVTHTGRDQRTALMIAKAADRRQVAELLTEAEKERGVWEDPRTSRPYCRAYYLRDLQAFGGWPETPGVETSAGSDDDGDAAGGEETEVVYLHQDFTVTRSMWHGEDVVFDDVSPEWRAFCERELEFAIPDDLL